MSSEFLNLNGFKKIIEEIQIKIYESMNYFPRGLIVKLEITLDFQSKLKNKIMRKTMKTYMIDINFDLFLKI